MIDLQTIKEQYIMKVLENIKGYKFQVFTDAGEYKKSQRTRNTVTQFINCLLTLSNPEVQVTNGGLKMIAGELTLDMLFPIQDVTDADGNYTKLNDFRDKLINAFSDATKFSVEQDGDFYNGAISFYMPVATTLDIRQVVGLSLPYSCKIAFTYLANALNTSDLAFYLNGEQINFTSFTITRNPTLTADHYKNSENDVTDAYSEGSGLSFVFLVPALCECNKSIWDYAIGKTRDNQLFTLTLKRDGQEEKTYSVQFGGVETSGNGVSNVVYKVTLVPFVAEEAIGG